MVIAKVRVNSVSAETVFCSPVPKGALGCRVAFEFTDRAWESLAKTVVFRNSRKSLNTVLEGDQAVIPQELLSTVKDTLYVGVYGTDKDRQLAIPTVWAKVGEIDSAANPAADSATNPSLPYWAQVLGEVEAMREEMAVPADLEKALQEAKESGAFVGPRGEKGDSPVRGTDYWTAADQKAVVAEAAAAVCDRLGSSADIVCEAAGSAVSVTDASDRELRGLRLYGRTRVNGTPEPGTPASLDVIAGKGSLTVKVGLSETDGAAQTLTVATPNGLPGVPVSEDGNYTDETGQQWLCDEVDLARGVYIRRIGIYQTSAATKWYANGGSNHVGSANLHVFFVLGQTLDKNRKGSLCDQFRYYANTGIGNETQKNVFCNFYGQANVAFDIDKTVAGTLDQWKAFVAQHPLTVQYILATPEVTPLPEVVLAGFGSLHTHKPCTVITNDAGAHMDAAYVADTKTYIDNRFAALSNLSV